MADDSIQERGNDVSSWEAEAGNGSCIHRWRIATPNGQPAVVGTCRCGAQRDFPVSLALDRNDFHMPLKYHEKLAMGGAWL